MSTSRYSYTGYHKPRTILLFVGLLGVSCAFDSFCDTSNGVWRPVWGDEFKSNKLNESKWTITIGEDVGQLRDAYGTAQNVYVEDGHLVLRSLRQQTRLKDGRLLNFTSGAITSKGKGFWDKGRVCVSARLPGGRGSSAWNTEHQDMISNGSVTAIGNGIWPAHWMMPNDSSCWPDHGEIDIMEMINGDGISHATYHWNRLLPHNCTGQSGNTAFGNSTPVANWDSDWHEYAVEYNSDEITFVVDSKVISKVTTNSTVFKNHEQFHALLFDAPRYIILNTAVGGPWPKPVDNSTIFPAYHLVDYVRVVQAR